MKRGLLIGTGIVVVLAGALLVAPSFVDWNKYKGRILAQLSEATGHQYDIAGPIDLAILPTPHVTIEGLSVKSPAAQAGAPLLTLNKAAVHVALFPLLSGHVKVTSVTLDKPVFDLGIDKNGKPTWMTPVLQAKQDQPKTKSDGGASDRVAIDAVRVTDGSIRFTDQRTGAVTLAEAIDFDVNADSFYGPYDANGSLKYKGERIELEAKAGAITNGNDTVSVKLKASLPASDSVLSYSGTVQTVAPYELQGQTSVSTDNLSKLVSLATGTSPSGLGQKAKLEGLMTYAGDSVALRDAVLSFGDMAADGSIVLSGLRDSPLMTLDVALNSDKLVDLDALLPKPKANQLVDANGKKVAPGGYLPATLSLPKELRGKVTLGLAGLRYQGLRMDDATVALLLGAKSIDGEAKAKLPGKGTLDATFGLAYAKSTPGASGAVTLSAPTLSYRAQAATAEPRALLSPFVAKDTLEKAGGLLASRMDLDVKGRVTERSIIADAGAFTLAETPLSFSGEYTPKLNSGRDMVTLVASADAVDADALTRRMQPERGQDAATSAPKGKSDFAAMAKSVKLPVDLDLGVSVARLRYQQNDYANVSVKARMIGNALSIANAGFQDDAGNTLNLSGAVADVNALKGVDLTASGSTPDADLLMKTLKIDSAALPDRLGAADAIAQFKGQADRLGFTANVKALRASVEASGALSNLLASPNVSDLTVRLRHPNYVELMRLFSPTFRSSVDIAKNLDVFATMQRTGDSYVFKDIRATVGPSTMTGEASFKPSDTTSDVTASLQFSTLPIDKLLGMQTAAASKGTVQATRSTSTMATGDARWSRNAINTDWMRKWNADIKATAGDASYGNWQFGNAVMAFTLKNGTLSVDKLNGDIYGGRVGLSGRMAAPEKARGPVSVDGNVSMENVSLESFVGAFAGSRLIQARGNISVKSAFKAAGISPAALIYDLNGNANADGSDIIFQGFDLAKLSRTLAQPSSSMRENFSGMLDGTISGGQTRFDKLDGDFTISGGVINFDKMALTGTEANVNTTGNVNLPLWTVALESVIDVAEPQDAPNLTVAFKGPLDNPGQTFGKGALESYFIGRFGSKIQDKVIDKLDKNGVLEKTGLGSALGSMLGVPVAPATAPATTTPPVPTVAPKTTIVTPSSAAKTAPTVVAPPTGSSTVPNTTTPPSASEAAQPGAASTEAAPVQATPAEAAPAQPSPTDAAVDLINGLLKR